MNTLVTSREIDMFNTFNDEWTEGLLHSTVVDDNTRVSVIALIYHVALYVNPESDGISMVYEHRYCYADIKAALVAITLFKKTGLWLLWQKDHSKQISVTNGMLYPPGVEHRPKYALGAAGWNEKDVAKGGYDANIEQYLASQASRF